MTIEEKFGVVLRSIRISKSLSQEDFAFKCGLHRTYIGSIERGERNLSLVNIDAICNALEVSPSQFFIEIEKIDKPI
ncbi:helix-turn-helix transcriptional regulator [Reichenbachiella carrageenanivorans]|uniref:Helix-turn-helix transcriptional regulator n=1 Tax=Reichenbachiella carrageenanivorans TaxID=2979869 RepID=A0ABY6CZX4_9BACT|nr:helix-turn-helix transcriptional regulator [Reichenbachiella carrageenanivorans]UXX79471.1 helix-turn-helix transcriptional regulator [Reichenbachiella carrageenanivorans]